MKLSIFCLGILVVGCVSALKDHDPLDDDAVIAEVNKQRLGWIAGKNRDTHKKSKKDKVKKLGNKKLDTPPPLSATFSIARSARVLRQVTTTIPTNFDARTRWPACAARIGDIRDQGSCGSCWANTLASVLPDRLCITKNLPNVKISVQDQIKCMPASIIPTGWSTDLCQGFSTLSATRMLVNTGVVTGGEVNQTNVGCKPYTNLAFTNGTGGLTCPTSCSNTAYTTSYTADKRKSNGTVLMGFTVGDWGRSVNYTYNYDGLGYLTGQNPGMDSVERLIQKEIMTRGSVAAAFDVYNDFYSYRAGINRKSNATVKPYLGSHAIKIIGWGLDVSTNTKFWTVVNSWGNTWGETGLFRILRGINEVKIEDLILGVIV